MASAANGIVGILFSAGLLSCNTFLPEADALGTCLVFQTSTDAGTTWERHPLPVPAGFSPAGITGLMFAADPTQNGHFTAALMNDATTEFLVLHTPDRGKTWTSPVKVTDDASKQHFAPWVAYSPDGVFGLMWRTYEPDPNNPNAQNLPWSVWAVISKDNGATFSKPLKMSLHDSPAAPDDPDDAFSFVGDHGPSGMALDSGHVYIAWSDWTPGERAIYFGAASYKAFEF